MNCCLAISFLGAEPRCEISSWLTDLQDFLCSRLRNASTANDHCGHLQLLALFQIRACNKGEGDRRHWSYDASSCSRDPARRTERSGGLAAQTCKVHAGAQGTSHQTLPATSEQVRCLHSDEYGYLSRLRDMEPKLTLGSDPITILEVR